MHSIVWFWTIGIHDPVWVQAIAACVLVALTFVTLAVLAVYAWDTHTLARVSVEQIDLVKKETTFENIRRNQFAYDCIFKTNDEVIKILRSLADGTFGTKAQPAIYPERWPEVTSALVRRKADMDQPLIKLGISLRAVDFAVGAFADASNNDDKREREMAVRKAVGDAVKDCKMLVDAMKGLGSNGREF